MRWLLAIFLFWFCASAQAEIVIGVAGPMTGTYAAFGAQMLQGVQAAVDDLNAKGGVEGDLLEIVSSDDACDNKQAEFAAQKLIDKNVSVVIGHFCSYPSLAAAQLYQRAHIPMIAPSASLPALTEAGLNIVLRLASRDNAQGRFAATRMQQDFPGGKIAVLGDGSAASGALVANFLEGFKGQPALALTFKADAGDFEGLVSHLKANGIAALYCACSASDAGVLAAKFNGAMRIYGSDALLIPQFWQSASEAGEGTLVSFAVDPQTAPEAKQVMKANKKPEAAMLASYAAVQVFANAAEIVGSKNSQAMLDFLRSGRVFPTVIGTLSFDQKGDVQQQRFVWYKWSRGSYAAESLGN
jgi:branched-chain amino acid transport system substrate-binding protein